MKYIALLRTVRTAWFRAVFSDRSADQLRVWTVLVLISATIAASWLFVIGFSNLLAGR